MPAKPKEVKEKVARKGKRHANISLIQVAPKKKIGHNPPSFSSPEDFEERAQAYLEWGAQDIWYLPNKAGLAVFLGCTRETLNEYSKKEAYSVAVKKIYHIIEDAWVQRLGRPQATGAIFYLKNAFHSDYRDTYDGGFMASTLVFVVPKEIAEKHKLQLAPQTPIEAETREPVHVEEK